MTEHMMDECMTCEEVRHDIDGDVFAGECLPSWRQCGHHCNHIWTHDVCHWCGATFTEDGNLVVPDQGATP